MTNQLTDLIRFGWQMHSGYRYRHEMMIADLRLKDINPYIQDVSSFRILDLANGQLQPQSLILHSLGQETFGIDFIDCRQSGLRSLGYKYHEGYS